jgi:3-oxoacyl-[acyl-carrier protein] reductase
LKHLTDKAALITGGGGGIGRGIAERFAKEGARLVIAEIDEDKGRKAVDELRALGAEVQFIKTDVRERAEVEAAVALTIKSFGGIDILVNNAFALSPNVPLEKKSDAMLESTMKSGGWAAWWAMKASLESMKARGGGKIINFFSIDAEVGAWFHADYNMSKMAILGLTRSAAAEWGRFNINVNAIAPAAMGEVFYKLAADSPGFAEAAAQRKPLGRNGEPEADVAPVVVFLASSMSDFVTGELIHVDGGLHLPGYNSKPADLSALGD